MNKNIQVFLRIRPTNLKEHNTILEVIDKQRVLYHKQSTDNQMFTFDQVFDEEVDNYEVYQKAIQKSLKSILYGNNLNVLLFGQTASGKTFTMMGQNSKALETKFSVNTTINAIRNKQHNNVGMIIYSLLDLFKEINITEQDYRFTLKASYYEIYNEQVYDLLNEEDRLKENLQVIEDPISKKFIVRELKSIDVTSMEEVFNLLIRGEKNRHYSSTVLNHNSSRSHVIFSLEINTFNKNQLKFSSKLNFIDLAGSEKINSVQIGDVRNEKERSASKERKQECQNINKSLFCLTRLLYSKSSLQPHIPYRDSTITKILKPTFDVDKSQTCVVLCINANDNNLDQNLQTIKFGVSSQQIQVNFIKKQALQALQEKQHKPPIQDFASKVNDDQLQSIIVKLKNLIKESITSCVDNTSIITEHINNVGIIHQPKTHFNKKQFGLAQQITQILYDYEGRFAKSRLFQMIEEHRLKEEKFKQEISILKKKVDDLTSYSLKQNSLIQEQKALIEKLEKYGVHTRDHTESNINQSSASIGVNFTSLINELSIDHSAATPFDNITLELSKIVDEVEMSRNMKKTPTNNYMSLDKRIQASTAAKYRSQQKDSSALKKADMIIEQFNKKQTFFSSTTYKPRSLSFQSQGNSSNGKNFKKQKQNPNTSLLLNDVEETTLVYNIQPQNK